MHKLQSSELERELKAIHLVKEKAERYVTELSSILNDLHDVEENEAYWSLLIDSWLIHFISVIIDRVANGNLSLSGIDESVRFKVPLESFDMNVFSREDDFNHNLQLALAKIKVNKFNWRNSIIPTESISHRNGWTGIITSLLVRLVRPKVFLVDSYFSHKDSFLLMMKSWMRIVSIPSKLLFTQRPACIDVDKRAFVSINEKDGLDMFMNQLLPVLFPQNLLELYHDNKNEVLKYTSSVKIIGSAVCIHSSDHYKILAAEIRKGGGRVIGFQHGGNYNIQNEMLMEFVEVKNVDEYVYWNDIRGFGATKLNQLTRSEKCPLDFQRILLISTSVSKYHFRAETTINPASMKEYFENQHSLYNHIDENQRQQFVIRAYPRDYGWNYVRTWNKIFGDNIRFDVFPSLEESLKNTSLLIVDHISTTWVEALYLNIPILFSFSIERYSFKEEVEEVFLKLKGLGVLFEYPEQAADALNKGIAEYYKLWMSKEVQNVINELKGLVYKVDGQCIENLTKFLMNHSSTSSID